MARCGCAGNDGVCACVLTAGSNVAVSGDGSPTLPYTISVSCEAIQDCVGTILGQGLTYNDPANLISAKISSQIGNQLTFGPDDGLFSSNGGSNATYIQAFKAAKAVGMSNADAMLIASGVGLIPAGFDPNAQTFTPLGVTYETSGTLVFTHSIAAAVDTWEKITEVPDLTIVEPGWYLVDFSALCNATIAGSTATITTSTNASIYRNGVQVNGSQVKGALVSQGTAAAAQPALQVQATGHGTFMLQCAANDALSLWGLRSGNITGTNQILSEANGRTRITATRIRL